MDPNGDSPVRPTLVCANAGCPTHQYDIFWSYEGEGPYADRYEPDINWIAGEGAAVGSWWRDYITREATR